MRSVRRRRPKILVILLHRRTLFQYNFLVGKKTGKTVQPLSRASSDFNVPQDRGNPPQPLIQQCPQKEKEAREKAAVESKRSKIASHWSRTSSSGTTTSISDKAGRKLLRNSRLNSLITRQCIRSICSAVSFARAVVTTSNGLGGDLPLRLAWMPLSCMEWWRRLGFGFRGWGRFKGRSSLRR